MHDINTQPQTYQLKFARLIYQTDYQYFRVCKEHLLGIQWQERLQQCIEEPYQWQNQQHKLEHLASVPTDKRSMLLYLAPNTTTLPYMMILWNWMIPEYIL